MKSIGVVALAAIFAVGVSTVAQARPDLGRLSQMNSVRSGDSLAMEPARVYGFIETVVSEAVPSFVGTPRIVSQSSTIRDTTCYPQIRYAPDHICAADYSTSGRQIGSGPDYRHIAPSPDGSGGWWTGDFGRNGCIIFPYAGWVGAFC